MVYLTLNIFQVFQIPILNLFSCKCIDRSRRFWFNFVFYYPSF